MSWKWIAGALAAAAAVVVAVVLIAGGDDSSSDAQQTDDDFIAQMVAHHELAIDMAEVAQERGEHAEIKALADAIVAAQTEEIDRMESIHERMFDGGLEGHDHGDLGMSESEMGMHMEMADLENAEQFDQAFIDAMVPHHQGAIRMARIELDEGDDPELAEIASAIITAQTAEIEQMNRWREEWYGAPSSSGESMDGMDSGSMEGMDSMEGMGH